MLTKLEDFILLCCLVFIILISFAGTKDPRMTADVLYANVKPVSKEKTNDAISQCKGRTIDSCGGGNNCSEELVEDSEVCKDVPDPTTKFECVSGKFIHVSKLCDGNKDCKDGLDEDHMTCYDESAETCELPQASTLRIHCEFKGEPFPCQSRVRAWTNVKIFCNIGYVPRNVTQWTDYNTCLKSGKWIHRMPSCTFECGTLIKESHRWNVLIYKQNLGYESYCQGTLITPYHVLTDRRCVLKINDNNELEYTIAIGHIASPQLIRHDEYKLYGLIGVRGIVEINDLGEIRHFRNQFNLPNVSNDDYQLNGTDFHETSNNRFEMAVFELSSHADPNEFRSVCFDMEGRIEINSYMTGKYATRINEKFKLLDFQILTYNDCRKRLNSMFGTQGDVLISGEFCAFYNHCEPDCPIHNLPETLPNVWDGSGLTININGSYYLVGSLSKTFLFKNVKNEILSFFLTFKDVREGKPVSKQPGRIVNIAVDEIKRSDSLFMQSIYRSKKCVVPYEYGTKYTIKPCITKKRLCSELFSYKSMAEDSTIFLNCKENFTQKGGCNYKTCKDGKWLPEDNSCVRLCEPLDVIPTVKSSCSYKGKKVSCKEKVMAGTVSTYKCESDGLVKDVTTFNNTCLHNGNWRDSAEVIQILCIDSCGILKSRNSQDEDMNAKNHPWNVGLYYEYKKDRYAHICGGTLISKFAVLSAAHCIHYQNSTRLDANILKIGLGKYYRKYSHQLDLHSQFRDVNNIYVPNLYDGPPSAFVADIVILELKVAADLNGFVVPACIDTSNQFALNHNSSGSVVSWGLVGSGGNAKSVDSLKKVKLLYMDRALCIEKSINEFNTTVRLTNDKFCSFNFRGEKIFQRGVSGSGLTFKLEGRHYIYGLVCTQTNNLTLAFTNVTYPYHLNFINRVLNQISNNKVRTISTS